MLLVLTEERNGALQEFFFLKFFRGFDNQVRTHFTGCSVHLTCHQLSSAFLYIDVIVPGRHKGIRTSDCGLRLICELQVRIYIQIHSYFILTYFWWLAVAACSYFKFFFSYFILFVVVRFTFCYFAKGISSRVQKSIVGSRSLDLFVEVKFKDAYRHNFKFFVRHINSLSYQFTYLSLTWTSSEAIIWLLYLLNRRANIFVIYNKGF